MAGGIPISRGSAADSAFAGYFSRPFRVIASQRAARMRTQWQASRSNPGHGKGLDCFVASLLAI